ncbi:hypothetical protein HNR42_002975 [Deinobacterium chartae]|uniref:Uncharacterized protein n=1 Tax=Deinobacterium chartae TaxID=521158 RepID=A0A841I6S0_9DEIO|nr:hypothetical protein [Deinobacterium chartae]MBB6099525.1 hypothetical protein [Deinobacterium chartae]
MSKWLNWILGVCVASALGACSSESFSYTGTWSGTARDSVGGNATFQATVVQSGHALTGTWEMVFENKEKLSGSLSGTVDSDRISMQMVPSLSNNCVHNATATRTANHTLEGQYTAACTTPTTGTFTSTRK